MQIAAFAHEISCYPDEATYRASQTMDVDVEGGAVPVKFAPKHFFPIGQFEAAFSAPGGKRESIAPVASFAGYVQEAAVRKNPETGQAFHVLKVETLGGILDVVVDPILLQQSPAIEGVAHGTFWLSGRMPDSTPWLPQVVNRLRGGPSR